MVADDLQEILVTGDDRDFDPLGGIGAGEGGNDIIGFKAGRFQGRDVEGRENPADVRELGEEIRGDGVALRFVGSIKGAAEGLFPRAIEDDGKIIRAVFLEEIQEELGEAEDGIGRHAAAGGELADTVIGAVDVTGAVE